MFAWCCSNVELDRLGTFDYINESEYIIDYKQ